MQSSLAWVRRHGKQAAYILVACLVGYWLFRGCVPGLGGSLLPANVYDSIRKQYTVCITDTPISPGDPRQPSCSQVTIAEVGRGTVPSDRRVEGLVRAVCYKVTYTTPHWTTLGTTRHEIDWSGRITSKVAVLQNGAWQTYADRDDLDQARWAEFGCPTQYESNPVTAGS